MDNSENAADLHRCCWCDSTYSIAETVKAYGAEKCPTCGTPPPKEIGEPVNAPA